MIKLSIITINYNNAEGLRKTLTSVASQTYRNIEHIIVDAASTDGSVDIIREYEDTIKQSVTIEQSTIQVKWLSEPDKGIYNAMNKGIEIALGKRVVDAFNCSEQREDKNKGVNRSELIEDKNKVFGVNVRVDEPRREDYSSQWAFERDHAKFDRLVDAAEACTWPNKSNTAPLHKVNCVRRSIFEDPVFATGGRNLIGETHWFE